MPLGCHRHIKLLWTFLDTYSEHLCLSCCRPVMARVLGHTQTHLQGASGLAWCLLRFLCRKENKMYNPIRPASPKLRDSGRWFLRDRTLENRGPQWGAPVPGRAEGQQMSEKRDWCSSRATNQEPLANLALTTKQGLRGSRYRGPDPRELQRPRGTETLLHLYKEIRQLEHWKSTMQGTFQG